MMVGHALLAFALAALGATRFGQSRERALSFGVVAAGFAIVPDVDMVYALFGLAQVGFGGVWEMTAAFWGSSVLVHRAVTHSLVVSTVAAAGFAWSTANRRRRFAAAGLLSALVWVTFAESGVLGAGVVLVFVLVGVGVAALAANRTALGARDVFAAALIGLLSHPFGDLFTGTPPEFVYPLDATLFAHRLQLHPDPTIHLLAAFGLELATIWFAGAVYLRFTERQMPAYVHGRAAFGAAYAIAAFVLPAPTLDVSYPFVFSILAVGVVGVAPQFHPDRLSIPDDRDDVLAWVFTGLAAITFAAVAYTAVYLVA